MVTLPAMLMAIHLPVFDERSQNNGFVLRQRAEHAKGMNTKFRNQGEMGNENVIIPPNRAACEHSIKGSAFNFRIQVEKKSA